MELRTSDIALVALADRAEARMLCRQLVRRGWQVLSSHDGAATREALRARPITLAIVEAGLPVMDGLEAVASARAAGWRGSVAFVDGVDRPEARQRAAALGAVAYLVQPVPSPSLWPVLQRLPDAAASAPHSEFTARPEQAIEFSPGTRLRLALGPRPEDDEAIITEVGAAPLEITVQGAGALLPSAHLGEEVRVGLPTRRGWGEFSSQVVGSYTRGQLTEITLLVPDQIVYHQRRHCARFRASLPLDAWPASPSSTPTISVPGQGEDVSFTGLKASLYAAIPTTEFALLELDLGQGAPIRATARPVWYQPPSDAAALATHRYGFEFVSPSRPLRGHLRRLLSQLRRAPGEPADWSPRDGPSSEEPTPAIWERGAHAHRAAD